MVILDVREVEEFQAEHIPNSILCPLSQLDILGPGILMNLRDNDVTIMCRSGKRAKLALKEIQKLDVKHHQFVVYEGGIQKWKAEGNPTIFLSSAGLPIMRQVQIGAGLLILISVLGGIFISPLFLYLGAFVGLGLIGAGLTGFCGLAIVLQRMPWNNQKSEQGGQCGC